MFIFFESLVLCIIFTIIIFFMSLNPIKTVYNYPPKIQERVRKLKQYKGLIPNKKNKLITKITACIVIIILMVLIMKYINGCTGFLETFICTFVLFTLVNLYDVFIIDCFWFCHDKRFIIKGTEDMKEEYHDYYFHITNGIKGELIALIVSLITGVIVIL